MHVGAGKNGADGHTTASGVQMQLVALPTDLVALRILLGSRGTSRVKSQR